MKWDARLRVALHEFWIRHDKQIISIAIIWLIIIIINQVFKNRVTEKELVNTYTPDLAIITDNEVPKKKQDTIKEMVEKYIQACNDKNYDEAYSYITNDCKTYVFGNDMSKFKEHIDSQFDNYKIYDLQNTSNVGDIYLYNLSIYDDIAATGTTGNADKSTEKVAFIPNAGGVYEMSIGDFIKTVSYQDNYKDDENISITLKTKDISYGREGYNFTIKNKTDKYVVISDATIDGEITILVGTEHRHTATTTGCVLEPGDTQEFSYVFNKFFDESSETSQLCFNSVRIFENYTSNIKDAIDNYSINIDVTE